MTFYVENETEKEFDFDVEKIAQEVALAALEAEACPYEVQVNLMITDNKGIQQYNREYRRIDQATDVLSFPNIEYGKAGSFENLEDFFADYFDPESGELMLGDIIISADRVRLQSEEYGHSEKREFAFLVAHSMLHLCGYDHMEDAERSVMEEKQEALLKQLGITRDN